MNQFPEYRGMSYERASREAARLLQRPWCWVTYFDRLAALREIMLRQSNARNA